MHSITYLLTMCICKDEVLRVFRPIKSSLFDLLSLDVDIYLPCCDLSFFAVTTRELEAELE